MIDASGYPLLAARCISIRKIVEQAGDWLDIVERPILEVELLIAGQFTLAIEKLPEFLKWAEDVDSDNAMLEEFRTAVENYIEEARKFQILEIEIEELALREFYQSYSLHLIQSLSDFELSVARRLFGGVS